MSSCLLVNRNLALKNDLKKLLRGNLTNEEWMSEFYDSDFILKTFAGLQFITHADKVQIIEELLISDSALKELLEVVKTTLKSKSKYFEQQVVKKATGKNLTSYNRLSGIRRLEFFKVNPLRSSSFIPILSPKLNTVIFDEIKSTFFSKTIWDRAGKSLVVDDVDLNRSLKIYKVELLQQLYDWIKTKNLFALPGMDRPLVTMSDGAFQHAYLNILKESWKLIDGMLDASLVINDYESASVLHNKVRPIAAFYLLLNFDECVSAFSDKSITIKTEYNQKSNLNFSDKYFRQKQENLPGDFADSYKDVDGDKLTSKLLKSFIQTVKLPNGKTLTSEFLNKLVIAVEALFEYDNGKYRQLLVSIIYGKNLTEEERLTKLTELLTKDAYFISKTSAMECSALSAALMEYHQAYQNTLETKATSLKARQSLPETYNILQLLFSHLTKSVMTYASVDKYGDLHQKTAVNYSKSKKSVWGSIEAGLSECLRKGMVHFFEEGFTVNGLSLAMITSIKDLTTQDILRRMTGLAFNTNTMLEAFSTPENLKILGNFLTKYCQIVADTVTYEESISPTILESTVDTVMKRLKSEPAYVAFSNLFVEGDSSYTIKLLDQSGNAIPIVGTHTTIASHWQNMEDVKAAFPEIENTNIQFTQKNIISQTSDIDTKDGNRGQRSSSWYSAHIVHATDVEVNGNVVRYSKLSPKRLALISIFSEYMRSVVEGGIMLTQIEAFSDKVRIAKGAFNIGATDLLLKSPKELVELAYEQHRGYYLAISRLVCEQLSLVLGFNITDLWQADRALRTLTEEQFRQKVLFYQQQPNAQRINILRDVHFSRFGKQLGINPMLLKEVTRAQDFKYWVKEYTENFKAFKADLKAEDVDATEYELNYHKLKDDLKATLLNMFGVESESDLPAFDNLSTKGWDIFFQKYFALSVLTRESDLLISLKHYWAHDKVRGFLGQTHEQVKRAVDVECGTIPASSKNAPSKTEIEEVKAAFSRENTSRGAKSKKRYNAGPASYTGWDLGTKYGLPDTINVAHIEHARQSVWNYFGNFNDDRIKGSESLNSHDGATFSTTTCRTLERSSASNRKVSSTLKTIMLQPAGAGFMQIKTADFEMNNAWVRWTKKVGQSPDPNFENFDGVEILYKMFSPAKVTPEFVQNWIKNIEAGRNGIKLGYDFHYKFLGKHAVLSDIQVDAEGGFDFIWKYDDGSVVPKDVVNRSLYDTSTRTKLQFSSQGNILINNFSLFELWQTFGGAYCMGLQEDGSIGYSDASQEILAGLMSEFDTTGRMKNKMIYKLIDEEASKSSLGVVNKKAQLGSRESKDDFVVNYIDSSRYGIQQDYGHEADGSKIPMLTQVLTAIAFNGENTPLVQHAYEVLGQIVEESLKKVTSKWEMDPVHRTAFHKEMGKLLLKQLETNSVASNASDIIKTLYEEMLKWGKDKGVTVSTIPYSDPQLFYLASSHLITRLNRESLKHKFEGIAVVQNPANGIVSVYEDINGVQYTATDITDLANEWLQRQLENNPNFTEQWQDLTLERVNKEYLLYESTSEDVLTSSTVIEIQIRDTVKDAKGKTFKIKNIEELKDLQNEVTQNNALFFRVGKFAAERLTIANFNILGVGDVVEVIDEDGNIYHDIINDPTEFKQYYDGVISGKIILTKLRSKPRDLAVTKITWNPNTATRDGKAVATPGNFWLLDSTQELVKLAKENAENRTKKRDINLEKWHAATLRGLADEVKPYIFLTKEDWYKGIKTYLNSSVLKKGGEEILPKQYKTLLGLRHSMSYIRNHPNYFEDLARQKYDLNPHLDKSKLADTDVAFVKENYDIIVTSSTAPDSPNTEWRMHKTGGVTHWILVDLLTNRELDGIDFIGPKPDFVVEMVSYNDGTKPTLYFHTQGISDVNWDRVHASIKTGLNNVISKNKTVQNRYAKNKEDIELLIKTKSAQLRTAFETSRLTISARIPSQSFQSFLANETVGYTESDVNDGYMNIWEMWFQGSDYDIDKAYTMMFGLDSTGAIAGNIFTRDCKTAEGIQKSLLLPTFSKEIGQTKKIATRQEAIELGSTGIELTQLLFDAYNIEKERPATSLLEVLNDLTAGENEGFYFRTIEHILTRQDKIKLSDSSLSTLSPEEQVLLLDLVNKINIYVATPESIDATKNRIVAAIRHASSDLRNLKASEVPMEPGEIGARIEDRAKRKKQPPYWNYNPFTLWRIQKENAVGKDDVGIAANGLKAAGAIQLYFNTTYNGKPLVVDGKTTWNFPRVSIDLNFSLSDAPNILYRFRRFNNTKVLSSAQLAEILGDVTQLPTYLYFTQLIGQSNWRDLIFLRLENPAIRNREARFLRNVIAYYDKLEALIGKGPIVPQESDFIEISFEEMETEPNVADTLSVFISLATDNAKELKLSKMNGRPELLSIPIAMATLGMEVDDMIDVCVDLMDAIGKEIDLADGGYVNVRDIIAEIDDPNLTPESKLSLLDLYDFAQELRALTTFFSVNQGVKAKLTELREFLNGLSRLKIQAEKNKGLTSATLAGKLNFKELVKKPGINGEKSEYQTGLITHYEGLKSGINVMDVIISSPHFRSQLESISETVDIIEKSTGKGRMMRLISEHTDAFDFKGMSKKERIDATNRAIRMADSYILELAFENMKHLQFSKLLLIADYPDYDPTINDLTTVGTLNIVQLKGLLQFVEHSLVPKLQEQFPDNFFLLNLTPDKDTLTGSTYLHLPFNLFATDESMYVAESVNMAMASFEEIAKYASGIKDLNGQDVSVGEFLYLYALVTSRNSISSMMTCTYSGVSKYSKLPKYVEEAYSHFDLIAQLCNVADNLDELVADETITESQKSELQVTASTALEEFNEFITKIYPYIYALAHKGTYEMSKGKLTKLEADLQREATPVTEDTEVMEDIMNADLNMHFSAKEFFLPTMDKGYSYDSFRSTSFNNQQTLDRIQSVVTTRLASQLGLTIKEITDIYKINITPPTSTQMIGLDGKTSTGYRVSLLINVAFVDGTDGEDSISFVFTGEDSLGNLYMKNVEELILRIASNLKTPTRILQDEGMSGKIHRNTSLSSGIITDSTNPNVKGLLDKIHTFITNPKSFILEHNGRPSVHYINDLKVYIVGSNPLSNSDMVRMYLMDLGHLSENAQLIALMQEIFPDMNILTIEDVHFLLKSDGVLEELKKTSSIIKDFILDIYENPATEYIKKLANIQLSKYQTALFGNRSIYFGDPEQVNKIGDIYKDGDGDEWIHLLNDEDNHPVLVRFNGFNSRPESVKETVKPIYGSFEGFKKVNTLVVPNTYILRSISPSDFSYKSAVEYRGDLVKVGDIITIKAGRLFFVLDIIHRRDGKGEVSRYLVVSALTNTKSKTKLELKDPYDPDFVTVQSPEVSTDITYQSNDSARKIDISQLAIDDKKAIILKMSEGLKVLIGADTVMLKTVIDDFIITVNNEQYPISTIDVVYADSLEHIGFNLLAACSITPEVIVNSEEFANYPEFRNGYVLPRVAKRKNYGEKEISIRAKGTMIGKDYYLGFNTDFLHIMPEGERYRIGDLILFDNQGQQDLAQVVNVENEQLSLLVVQHLANSKVKYISKTITTKEARVGTHYRKSATVTPARVSVQENAQSDMASMSLKGKRMLLFLGDKFNTTVEIISDSRLNFVAKVENGKVIINTAKKPASESVEKFVATQAIHEFTHLMLAYLRAQLTDVYLSIMRNVNATLSADQLEGEYTTEIQRLEENLVRQITTFAESGLPSQDLSALDISYLFTRIVNAFLGVKGQNGKSLILREQMVGTSTASEKTKAYKFFEFLRQEEALDNWRMDVNSIQHLILLDEIMENIMKCKITT